MARAQKITPFLWYEKDAKNAAKFYVSVFGKNSKITNVSTMKDTPSGTVEIVTVELFGQEFTMMTAGPFRVFNEAISFVVHCKTQAEVDKYWKKLSAGGKEVQCGWLEDKYGLSWQIVPTVLGELLSDKDAAKSQRVMQAMLKMVKLDINKLKQAAKEK